MVVFRSSLLAEIAEATVCEDSRTAYASREESRLAFASCRATDTGSRPPSGLVVSSDDEVSRKLAESLLQCGLAPLFASTVAEAEITLAGRDVLVVLSNEWLADGTYEEIADLVRRSHTRIPLVVVSRTGEWPEYLRAVDRGAFDYVAYPPVCGDLERAIGHALDWNTPTGEVARAI